MQTDVDKFYLKLMVKFKRFNFLVLQTNAYNLSTACYFKSFFMLAATSYVKKFLYFSYFLDKCIFYIRNAYFYKKNITHSCT